MVRLIKHQKQKAKPKNKSSYRFYQNNWNLEFFLWLYYLKAKTNHVNYIFLGTKYDKSKIIPLVANYLNVPYMSSHFTGGFLSNIDVLSDINKKSIFNKKKYENNSRFQSLHTFFSKYSSNHLQNSTTVVIVPYLRNENMDVILECLNFNMVLVGLVDRKKSNNFTNYFDYTLQIDVEDKDLGHTYYDTYLELKKLIEIRK